MDGSRPVKVPHLHDWDIDYGEARELQEELASRVRLCPLPEDVRVVAGADAAFSRKAGRCFAAVVVMEFPPGDVVERHTAVRPTPIPYIPGLLSFREGNVVLEAFREVEQEPDAVIFDGQGRAHPRRLGLASHMGLWLGVPTVGCAKSRLVGEYEQPGRQKGEHVPLTDEGERIGDVVRTRTDVKPVFVSPGHLSDVPSSRELVLRCCTKYKLPEPTRQAHIEVGKAKTRFLEGGG